MKNVILSILFSIALIACNTEIEKKTYTVDLEWAEAEQFVKTNEFSNPAFIYGTDFGNFFKVMYAQGKFEDMVKFTSKSSISKHGKDKIFNFYKNDFRFGYELDKLKSTNQDGNVTILNYPNAHILATKKVIRIPVVIENDSCKVVLPNKISDFLR